MKLLFYCLLLFSPVVLTAQKGKGKSKESEFFVLYDGNWQPCKIDSARYMAYVKKGDDTTYQWNIYNFAGPLINIETYKDKEGTIPNGYFAFFDGNGMIDSSGYSLAGLKHGTWYQFDDTAKRIIKEKYDKGKLLERIDLRKENDDRDTSFIKGDRAGQFPGEDRGWIKYLQQNINFPDRALNLGKSGKVLIDFVINTEGKIESPFLIRSVEFSIDQEAMRLITESPDWIPAIKNGKKVNAYRRQPLTFAPPR